MKTQSLTVLFTAIGLGTTSAAHAADRYWVAGLFDWWDSAAAWSLSDGGAGGAGQPLMGDTVHLTDPSSIIGYRNATNPLDPLHAVFVVGGATQQSEVLLIVAQDDLTIDPSDPTAELDIGTGGHGRMQHSDGAISTPRLKMGTFGGVGTGEVSGTATLSGGAVSLGLYGTGTIVQTGGDVNCTSLVLGNYPSGVGTCDLQSGVFSVTGNALLRQGAVVIQGGDLSIGGDFNAGDNTALATDVTLSSGSLVCSGLNVEFMTEFVQSGGSCSVDDLRLGWIGASDATYLLSGGVLTTSGSGVWSGAGGFTHTAGTHVVLDAGLQINGSAAKEAVYDLQGGLLDVQGGANVNIDDDATFRQSGGTALASGTVRIGSLVAPSGRLEMVGGSLDATGIENWGELRMDGGLMTVTVAELDNTVGGTVLVKNGATLLAPSIVNDGQFYHSEGLVAGGVDAGTGQYTPALIVNDGTYSRVTSLLGPLHATFVNRGTITGSIELVGQFQNQATITSAPTSIFEADWISNSGVCRLWSGGRLTSRGPVIQNSGLLEGIGRVEGGLSNVGTIAPGLSASDITGRLVVDGDVTLASPGTLRMDIGGTTPGIDQDVLALASSAALTLGGTLDCALVDGFETRIGDSVSLIETAPFSNVNGAFDEMPGTIAGSVSTNAGGVVLIVDTVRANFDDGSTEGWSAIGDVASLDIVGGAPGGRYLQFLDAGTGGVMTAVAPPRYDGDWSSGNGVGHISLDVGLIDDDNGAPVPAASPAVFLAGPGGAGYVGFDIPPNTEWRSIVIPLEASAWTMTSGSFNAMLDDITSFYVRMEWLTGVETTGLDNVVVSMNPAPDPTDTDGDGTVGVGDLLGVLAAWGPCQLCPEDVNDDGVVDVADLLSVLAGWD